MAMAWQIRGAGRRLPRLNLGDVEVELWPARRLLVAQRAGLPPTLSVAEPGAVPVWR